MKSEKIMEALLVESKTMLEGYFNLTDRAMEILKEENISLADEAFDNAYGKFMELVDDEKASNIDVYSVWNNIEKLIFLTYCYEISLNQETEKFHKILKMRVSIVKRFYDSHPLNDIIKDWDAFIRVKAAYGDVI